MEDEPALNHSENPRNPPPSVIASRMGAAVLRDGNSANEKTFHALLVHEWFYPS